MQCALSDNTSSISILSPNAPTSFPGLRRRREAWCKKYPGVNNNIIAESGFLYAEVNKSDEFTAHRVTSVLSGIKQEHVLLWHKQGTTQRQVPWTLITLSLLIFLSPDSSFPNRISSIIDLPVIDDGPLDLEIKSSTAESFMSTAEKGWRPQTRA